jgi:NDP-sugar pyrophosphorylase family protein
LRSSRTLRATSMKAMIFAAGLGTRLRPLTDTLPKALVRVGDKPLLQWTVEKLVKAGISEIVINVHHFPDLIRDFLTSNRNFGISIQISDESDAILDTGGGLKKAAHLLAGDEPILIHNVDIVSNLDLSLLLKYHLSQNALATLVVRKRKTDRNLLFDTQMRLTGWINTKTREIKEPLPGINLYSKMLAFSGIQIIDPRFLQLMTVSGKFSLIDSYLHLAPDYRIIGYEDYSSLWMDVGKPEQLAEAERLFPGSISSKQS